MKRPQPRPLIETAEGRDQDDRASLWSAWRRLQSTRVAGSTDLHVRELLFVVHALDRTGDGAELTHTDLADRLETTPATVRRVIRRAVDEFGLLRVRSQRYVTGGTRANRYSIDWTAVRSTNLPSVTPADATTQDVTPASDRCVTPASDPPTVNDRLTVGPPVLTAHPPALTEHPPVLTAQAIEETTRTLSSNPSRHSPPPRNEATATAQPVGWVVVVSALVDLGMSVDGSQSAITAAQRRELTPGDVMSLVDRYRRDLATTSGIHVGWLHRWITGRSRPPEPPQPKPAPATSSGLLSAAQQRAQARERLRSRIIRAGREANAPEAVIDRRVQEALERFDQTHNTKDDNHVPNANSDR
jgi:hypothetical protein